MHIGPWTERLIALALEEDVGAGDPSASLIPPGHRTEVMLVAREALVLAGLPVAEAVFRRLDPDVEFAATFQDGDAVPSGGAIASIRGATASILTAERTALNFIQRLSGIATFTREAAARLAPKAKLVDTRKTTPGHRTLEKYAVRCGGGQNHRMGLYDGIMIKDNHIAALGGVRPAVKAARAAAHHLLRIECEVDTLDQVREAVDAGADVILLDNMSDETLSQAVALIDGRALTEASGGVSMERLRTIGQTGVDFVSMGALTQSARAVDIGLDWGAAVRPS